MAEAQKFAGIWCLQIKKIDKSLTGADHKIGVSSIYEHAHAVTKYSRAFQA